MFEKGKQLEAVEGAPGAVEVLPGLRLLPAVVIVEELVHYPAKNIYFRQFQTSASLCIYLIYLKVTKLKGVHNSYC